MKRETPGITPFVEIERRHLFLAAFIIASVIMSALLILPVPYNFIPFIIIFGAGFLFLSIKYSMMGIFIYMVIFFVRPQELFPHVAIFSYPYEKIVAIIVIANLVLDYAVSGKKIKIFAMDKAILLIMAVCFVSIITSIWISWSWHNFDKFFKTLLVYFFMSRLIDTPGKFKWIVWLYVLSTGFIAISSTISYYQGNYQTTMGIQRAVSLGESGGAYGDPNTMAATLVLGIPFLFYLTKVYRSRIVKLFLLGNLAACIWTVIITGSRGGMLAAAFTILLIAWNSRQKVVALVVAVLVMVGALAVMPSQYLQRLSTISDYNDQNDTSGAAESAQGRIKGLKTGFEILTKRPLAGAGIGCFTTYNYLNHGTNLNPHNLLGQVMGELGGLGLIAFGFLIYMLFKHSKYIRSKYEEKKWAHDLDFQVAFSVMISTITLLFLGLFGHNAYRFNWYIYACFLAIIMNHVIDREKRESEPIAPQNPATPEIST